MVVETNDFSQYNIVLSIGITLGWLSLLIIAIYMYRKQQDKSLKIWVIALIIYIGMFSFSFSFTFNQESLKLAILPLGVWFLLIVLPQSSKDRYRPYAWLGFCANYLFLFITILISFIHDGMYPKTNPATFISNLDDADLIAIHPSAQPAEFNKKRLQEQLEQLTAAEMQVIEWHRQSTVETEEYYQRERFPYLLVGVKASRGSGLSSTVHIENDGKGLLLTTPNQQLYYRVGETLLERKVNDAN
ncbi:hypothetical protein [Paenibacillus agilis]|uniref:Uncharacterized protein n=1 Tax=Paenibacillus agilis TaxID=3020863 RepID=A0A559IXX1_9BACL|nr:hypothetical protein [Paenibacillus agilis]TVX92480.1 hypothetical protein FPZ44_05075 [Paenibacillus agilis]